MTYAKFINKYSKFTRTLIESNVYDILSSKGPNDRNFMIKNSIHHV